MSEWADRPRAVREGEELDLERLRDFLEIDDEIVVEQFPSGFSNLTYLLRAGEREMVLRRPPFGSKVKSAHDMGREYRILSALAPVYAKAPTTMAYCEDDSVLGAPFYVMQRVPGVILRGKMPKEMIPSAEIMSGVADALIDGLAELHAVDVEAAGLGDLGRPEGYVTRQIEGWTKRWRAAQTGEVDEIERAAAWLANDPPGDSLSPSGGATLIHNDFKYDNVVLDSEDWTKIVAVLDWEMTTLGDPLMDLGTSLGYWVDRDDPPAMQALQLSPTTLPGNPSRAGVAQRYAEASGRDLGDVVFYYVYGLFKIAVIVQQIYYRYQKGLTKDPRFAQLDHAVRACGVTACQAIEKKRIDRLF